MAVLPKIKLKSLVSFPSNVYGGTGIDVSKTSGNYTVDLDYSEFVISASMPANTYTLVWDPVIDNFTLVPPTAVGGIADAPSTGTIYGRRNAAWVAASVPSDTSPVMNSVAAAGALTTYSRGDHVHPSDTTKIGDAPNDGSQYARQSLGWQVVQSSGLSTAEYTYNATTTPPPGAGVLRTNNANQTLATNLYLNEVNAQGTDIQNALRLIVAGDTILIQDKTNAANARYYTASGPAVDSGTYFTIPVTYTSGSTAFTAGRVIFAVFGLGTGGGALAANARIDAGIAAALDVAIAVKAAMQNIPDDFTVQHFIAAKIQLDALTEAVVAMLQAQAAPPGP